MTWQALNKTKTVEAKGSANKQAAWLMSQEHNQTVEQIAVAPTVVEPALQAPAPTPVVEAPAPVVATVVEAAVTEAPVAPTEPVVEKSATAPVAEPVVVPAKAETVVAPAPAPAAQPAPVVAAPEVQAPAVQPVVNGIFSVNGWLPKDPSQLLVAHESLQTVTDQQGCKAYLRKDFSFGDQGYSVASTGASCEGGFLSGLGNLSVTRTDGASLFNLDAFFKNGLPFHKDDQASLPIVDMDEEGNAYLLLEKDITNQYYYLLKVDKKARYWDIDRSNVYLLTESKDTFRQAESIKTAVLLPVKAIIKNFESKNYDLRAVTDFSQGLVNRDSKSWLYKTNVRGKYGNYGNPESWSFDPSRATNYMFQNEAREAQEEQQRLAEEQRKAEHEAYLAAAELERQAEEVRQQELRAQREAEEEARQAQIALMRLAQQAMSEIETYENYRDQQRDLPELIASKLNSVSYRREGRSDYVALLNGSEGSFSQIVNITDQDKDIFTADYPYPISIDVLDAENDVELSKGWYILRGVQKIDLERQDKQGLPLTVITPTDAYACESKGCTDFFTPLNLTRLEHKKPGWTLEQAEQQIEDAQKVQE
ncbi:MAG: hypothetical protein GX673_10150 [Gammaproteobacteria bacterium]|nr:hypothetical protein [Gammaproteobacteria bacterium]